MIHNEKIMSLNDKESTQKEKVNPLVITFVIT